MMNGMQPSNFPGLLAEFVVQRRVALASERLG